MTNVVNLFGGEVNTEVPKKNVLACSRCRNMTFVIVLDSNMSASLECSVCQESMGAIGWVEE